MAAGEWNILIEQGATWARTITWYSDDAGTTPVDLTGYTARMQVKTYPTAGQTAIVELTTENGRIALGGAAGTIILTLTGAQTDALMETAAMVYDLELEAAGGTVTRLLEGTFEISEQVTV